MTRHALPCALPAGERILWQGQPEWRALAKDALHLRGLGLYFGGLVAWFGVSQAWSGVPLAEAAAHTGIAAAVAAVPLCLGLGYAWFAARAATYTITNRRVVIRMGAAMPMTVNLPFGKIDGAGLRARSGGTGEIKLQLAKNERLSAVVLWPHARILQGQPALRGLADAEQAAQVLSRALAASIDAPAPVAVSLAPGVRVVEAGANGHGEAVAA